MKMVTKFAYDAAGRMVREGAKSYRYGYSPVAMTAFGDTINCQLPTTTFFTGKPHVDGLGHAFLLRNYRADLGKWPTADPLGYPDGWNQMVYCNGQVISCIDFMGADIYHVVDSEGAIAGAGRSTWIIGDDENGYTAYDYQANGLSGSGVSGSSSDGETRRKDGFSSLQEALNYLNSNREGENKFDKMQKWDTTPEQDAVAKKAADDYIKEDYSLLGHNCYQLGVYVFNALGIPIDPGPRPNGAFESNKRFRVEIINILE